MLEFSMQQPSAAHLLEWIWYSCCDRYSFCFIFAANHYCHREGLELQNDTKYANISLCSSMFSVNVCVMPGEGTNIHAVSHAGEGTNIYAVSHAGAGH